MAQLYGTSTMTEPSCSLTLYVATFKVGITVKEPVRTSNFHPCQGHVTTEPLRFPSPNGPPRCRQTLAIAKYSSLTRNRARLLPSTLTTLPNPSVKSLFSATLTNLGNRDSSPFSTDLVFPTDFQHLSRFRGRNSGFCIVGQPFFKGPNLDAVRPENL